MDVALRKLIQSDPQYQKKRKQEALKIKEFHKNNPQMKDLLMKSDEETTYLMTNEE